MSTKIRSRAASKRQKEASRNDRQVLGDETLEAKGNVQKNLGKVQAKVGDIKRREGRREISDFASAHANGQQNALPPEYFYRSGEVLALGGACKDFALLLYLNLGIRSCELSLRASRRIRTHSMAAIRSDPATRHLQRDGYAQTQ